MRIYFGKFQIYIDVESAIVIAIIHTTTWHMLIHALLN